MRVKAGNVSITPAAGFKTLGEVAMLNGSVIVTAKDGALQVDDNGTTKNVARGQTIVVAPKTAQNKGGQGNWGDNGETGWHIAILGAAGAGAILAGIAMSRAGDANTAANSAISAAEAAGAAASAAGSTASVAASEAAAAASAAAAAEIYAECNYDYAQSGTFVSPIVLPSGSCPTYVPPTAD